MAAVTLEIGGSQYSVARRDGEEAQLERLGRLVDARWTDAQRAAGDANSLRVMLLVALMLADDLADAQAATTAAPATDAALARLAERLEGVADALEKGAARS